MWRQKPLTPAYCCDYGAEKLREGIRAAVKGKAEKICDTEWRERYGSLFANKPAYADVHADVIALNRSLKSALGAGRRAAWLLDDGVSR